VLNGLPFVHFLHGEGEECPCGAGPWPWLTGSRWGDGDANAVCAPLASCLKNV